MKKKFNPNKKSKKKKRARDKKGQFVKTKDPRLDDIVPLFVDIIGRLLAAKGMLRYRTDFKQKVEEIMDE